MATLGACHSRQEQAGHERHPQRRDTQSTRRRRALRSLRRASKIDDILDTQPPSEASQHITRAISEPHSRRAEPGNATRVSRLSRVLPRRADMSGSSPLLGSDFLAAPSTPRTLPALTPTLCGDVSAFRGALCASSNQLATVEITPSLPLRSRPIAEPKPELLRNFRAIDDSVRPRCLARRV